MYWGLKYSKNIAGREGAWWQNCMVYHQVQREHHLFVQRKSSQTGSYLCKEEGQHVCRKFARCVRGEICPRSWQCPRAEGTNRQFDPWVLSPSLTHRDISRVGTFSPKTMKLRPNHSCLYTKHLFFWNKGRLTPSSNWGEPSHNTKYDRRVQLTMERWYPLKAKGFSDGCPLYWWRQFSADIELMGTFLRT